MTSEQASSSGRVVLVGGGPGALDLLTLRAVRELERADVIVADRLGPTDELDGLNISAEIVPVGKSPYHHPVPQDRINELLVEYARSGKHVVRLKGGDPFVLGRGGEELLYCREHGIDVEVVPGVTSAFSAPLAGGIPVTHRGLSAGVMVLSGHDELLAGQLAAWPHTIVVLMGMARLDELAASLVQHGKSEATPAAVVHYAWTDQQRVVKATLATIGAQCAAQQIGNPSVIVIGDVVNALGVDDLTRLAADAQARDSQ